MSPIILVLILTCIANMTLGILIFLRNPKLVSSKAFLCISFFISLWAITNYLTNLDTINNLALTNTFNRAAFVTAYLAIESGLVFSYFFPQKRQVSRTERYVLGTIGVLTTALSCTPYVAGVATLEDGRLAFTTGSFVWMYVGSILIAVLVMFRNLTLVVRNNDGSPEVANAKIQAKFVLAGIVASVSLGLVMSIIIPIVFSSWHTTNYGPALSIILVGSISYAIVRHKLFDIRSFVIRGAVYIVTTILLSLLYVAPMLYILGTVIMGFPFVLSKFLVGVAVGTFAAINYDRIRKRFDRVSEKVFFRDNYDSASLLGQLNRLLVTTTDLHRMLESSSLLIANNLKSEFCTFVLKSNGATRQRSLGMAGKKIEASELDKIKLSTALDANVIITDYVDPKFQDFKEKLLGQNIAVVVRLNTENDKESKDLGYMVLGYKRSGNPYNAQDMHVLETISDVLVIAIQNALHYEEIQNFNITLQRKVDEATRQLRRTNAKLQALDETKDDFISMASHQLRTPLTSVKGYLSMVLEGDAGKVTPMQRKMLDQAFVSSQRMVFLIADLLNISRLKTGKFVIEPSKVNLAQVVADEVRQLEETAKGRSLELLYERPADFPLLMLDEMKTRQVIMNFIDNAIHYTLAGGSIRVELVDKPSSVEFRVTDTGIGVPRAEQPHLFTKFYRAGNARRTRPDGTGLGLFMAKKVVVAQGGAVLFESREGKGSTFGFVFSKTKLAVSAEPQRPA